MALGFETKDNMTKWFCILLDVRNFRSHDHWCWWECDLIYVLVSYLTHLIHSHCWTLITKKVNMLWLGVHGSKGISCYLVTAWLCDLVSPPQATCFWSKTNLILKWNTTENSIKSPQLWKSNILAIKNFLWHTLCATHYFHMHVMLLWIWLVDDVYKMCLFPVDTCFRQCMRVVCHIDPPQSLHHLPLLLLSALHVCLCVWEAWGVVWRIICKIAVSCRSLVLYLGYDIKRRVR